MKRASLLSLGLLAIGTMVPVTQINAGKLSFLRSISTIDWIILAGSAAIASTGFLAYAGNKKNPGKQVAKIGAKSAMASIATAGAAAAGLMSAAGISLFINNARNGHLNAHHLFWDLPLACVVFPSISAGCGYLACEMGASAIQDCKDLVTKEAR